ncbi:MULTISPECIES: hypothetical protein [Pseudoalteromonas]|jgi:hypothetical protein|uniref:hypothetical protein n=1 Tax=Pseudoalteromonas TaxID=53246 RepID=UPI0007E4E734|nr:MULTISPECIES: hypothetical protein [Pseudoalteromonas]MBE0377632.1 hypothetical protein [Pseudoalteromonas prydzensis ACAM 620]TVU69104.1 hypothetical protein FQP81_19560 [Pseudoalteromonas elyakovii]|tara:strand:+ start:972 stop:1622 length:651 start_codon:yes stop_codon:yes gene_type:complete
MRCFARWEKDDSAEVFFRDQTILQFGDSWDFLANVILLNPGSALPMNEDDKTELLRSKGLPFFVEPDDQEKYLEFFIDPLMRYIFKLFKEKHSGGSIRLYNLFNLKNQHSNDAINQIKKNSTHSKMFAKDHEIKFCNAPVLIASGGNAKKNTILKQELTRYISLVESDKLFKLAKQADKQYSILKATPDKYGFIESYHPSFTFKYGNATDLGQFKT